MAEGGREVGERGLKTKLLCGYSLNLALLIDIGNMFLIFFFIDKRHKTIPDNDYKCYE